MEKKVNRLDFIKTVGLSCAAVPFIMPTPYSILFKPGQLSPVLPEPGGLLLKPAVMVKNIDGIPTFAIDGKPFLLPVMETYNAPDCRQYPGGGNKQYFTEFASAGTRVFSMNTNTGEHCYNWGRPTWPEPDRFDYSGLDEWIHNAIATRPDALVIPRIYIGAPKWWIEQNPAEMELWEDGSALVPAGTRVYGQGKGPYPCLASEKWRNDMAFSLRKMIGHMQNSDYKDRVFGFLLAGLKTEEWWHWGWSGFGYSSITQKAFQSWLKQKYSSVSALQKAWNNSSITFDAVTTPSKSEREYSDSTFRKLPGQMNVIDFYSFYNELIPDTISYFGKVIKEATSGKKVVGGFYSTLYFGREPEMGQNALSKYLASPYLDFHFVTMGYDDRQPGGSCYTRSAALSARLHGKLWYDDVDLGSYLNTPNEQKKRAEKKDITDAEKEAAHKWVNPEKGLVNTLQESIGQTRRSAGFTICNGIFQSFFDIWSGSFSSPEMLQEVKNLNGMFQRSINHSRLSNSQILVVVDENSNSYCRYKSSLLSHALLNPQFSLSKLGAPVDQVLAEDLHLLDTKQYKLVIFLNTYNLNAAQRQMIDKKIKGNKRTVLWCYAPGLFRGSETGPELMNQLTGINLQESEDEKFVPPQIQLNKSANKFLLALAKTGFDTIGDNDAYCKPIWVTDKTVTALGNLPGTDKTTLAIKDMGSWTSVYSITADLAPEFYKELARLAGVHIWSEKQGTTFYANKGYVCLHANGDGQRTITFPRQCAIWDALIEKKLAVNTRHYNCNLKHGETVILRWK